MATETAVGSGSRGSPRRGRTIVVVLVGALLLEVVLSMAWPRQIPRFGFLPRPPERTWTSDCSPHHLYYTRSGAFWVSNDASLPIACGRATKTSIPPLAVGETARLAVTETVMTYLDHVLDQRGINLPTGGQAKAEVRVCATAASSALVMASDFVLRLSDGEVLPGRADTNFEQPLPRTQLRSSQCVTGYISWLPPRDQYLARSITDTTRRVTWTISCRSASAPCVDPVPSGSGSTPTAATPLHG